MTKLTRTCADCSTDISDRHGRAVYCNPCVIAREKARNARQRPRHKRICEHCGETFETRHQQRFCSHRCAGLANTSTPTPARCVVCDTEFMSHRRSTCSAACYKWHKKHPDAKPPTHCGRCGEALKGVPLGTLYCSRPCLRAAWAVRTGRAKAFKLPNDACETCGGPMASHPYGTRFCSHRCQAFKGHERRSRKISTAPVEDVRVAEIYERDNWTCHLCRGPIDPTLRGKHPLMVSLDHIIPIDDPGYPGHVWENLAAAHLRCNISKGPRATGRDWKLYTELKSLREGATTWPPKRQALAQLPLFDAWSTTGLTAKAQPSSCPALPGPSPDARPH